MKNTSILCSVLLALALAVTGCAPEDEAPATAEPEAEAGGEGIELTGDFEGPLGVQLYSVREAMQDDVPGTLQQVYDMGFREVELAGTYGMSAERFKQALDSIGLEPTAMHVGYEVLESNLDSALAQAETLGVDYIGVAWIPHPEGEPFTVEMAREAAVDFNAWGAAAQERGLQFYYHNHGYEFQPTADGTIPFDVLMAETDPEDVKYEMDVFWTAHPGVDPAALLRQYPDRWDLMHIKDMAQGTPTGDFSGHAPPEAQVPVGTGQIDYRAVLEAAEEIGLEKYYIEDETTDPLGNIPQSITWIETVGYSGS